MKAKNPQIFQQFQNLQKSQNNPQEFLNQIISKYTPEQIKAFRQYASGFGVSEEQLNKYGISANSTDIKN